MNRAFLQFKTNIQATKDLKNTVDQINSITTNIIDLSDLYRSQIVLTVSALDYFIHEITMIGMIEIYNLNRPSTPAFLKFQIPISNIYNCSICPSDIVLRDTIKEKHSWLSFQDPDKISEALRLITERRIWEDLGIIFGLNPRDLKTKLKLIIDRRNKIAHEADMNPTYPGVKWPISSSDVEYTIDFIENLVTKLFNLII
jgi:hypothetical protein